MKKIFSSISKLFKSEEKENDKAPIRIISQDEAQLLEKCLAEIGLPFENNEAAEQYYFDLVKKDEEKVNELIKINPKLYLDFLPDSLLRLEDFYIKCFIEKTEKTEYSKENFEYLITQYVRHIYVKGGLARWAAISNDFSEKNYELGIRFDNYGDVPWPFGSNLDNKCDVKKRNYLLEIYNIHAS